LSGVVELASAAPKLTLVAAAAVIVQALLIVSRTLKVVVSAAVAGPARSRATAQVSGERTADRMDNLPDPRVC